LDISSSRMDADTGDITANGLGNCLTRDGQGSPTANLPMNGFRHTGVQNAVARTDYAALGQVQDDLLNWTIAGGTSDAITATYTPALTVLNDGQICFVRATAANATTTPNFSPNGLTPRTITRTGGNPLVVSGPQFSASDIPGGLGEMILRYNATNTRWELLNPSNGALNPGIPTTGAVMFTLASSAPYGWLMFDDGTFGSASSNSSNSNSAFNQALFNILFAAPFTDATAPMFTSTGSPTTRAALGTAAAAWANNCRMSLPKTLGRALAVAGSGSGLTSFAAGQTTGANTHTIAAGEIPSLTSVNASQAISVTSTISDIVFNPNGVGSSNAGGGSNGQLLGTVAGISAVTPTGNNSISVTYTNGSQTAISLMQPTSFLNAMVKV
jgi:hypothetical protein